ncbi:MAG: sigma-54-dependent Fis family transcriptional regulator, partial [Candidatus Wallbacteria bacterium]|nr:sigma-54-dependent Fis family transcriptional regulator [Candidatus Wallbacteria bacterium]
PEILERNPRTAVVVMSGRGSIELAVAAIKAGAVDFLSKPFGLEALRSCIAAALEGRPARATADRSMIGQSPAMLEIAKLVRTFAPMDLSVLLLGETGTGKEVLARSLHNSSSVASGPFVDVDCSALPATLLEAELFGTEKGAFTDARERRLGKFELADGGTLFLDEIGNLTYDGQARLLRVLQERSFRRVGGTKLIEVDVRVIAATNLDLEEEVRRGAFRQDLYFRLAEMTLELPPLRERTGDVLLLAVHFLEQFNGKYGRACPGFSAEAVAALEAYSWPGNVRELQSTVRTALLLCTASIEVAHLPGRLRPAGSHPAPLGELPAIPAVPGSLFTYPLVWPERGGQMDLKQIWRHAKQQLEREIIFGLLRRFGYTKADLARCLDLDYKVLLAKLRELEIELKPHG